MVSVTGRDGGISAALEPRPFDKVGKRWFATKLWLRRWRMVNVTGPKIRDAYRMLHPLSMPLYD